MNQFTLADIEWTDKTPYNNTRHIAGYVNDQYLFEIRVEGSRVFTYKLLAYPVRSDVFVAGNNSKVIEQIKYDERADEAIDVLKFIASCKLNEYVNLFEKKPQLYKVKLADFNTAKEDQINTDGYLKHPANNNKPATYTRGQAIKKAQLFNGKIEKV